MAQRDWNPRSMYGLWELHSGDTFHPLAVILGPGMDREEYTEW